MLVTFFVWSFETPLYRGAPKGGRGGVTRPQGQRNRNLKTKTLILYTTSNILRNWPFSRNHLLQSADEEYTYITILRIKLKNLPYLNSLNPELNPICYLLALLVAHHFLHVSRIRVKLLTFRLLMSYIYGAPILDVSRSHTTTHHSR